jgi:hypothetical protein
LINNNYITYTINIYASTPWFGLDVRKADGGLCYSSETPQMRVRSTSSVDVSYGVNFTPGADNQYLETYEPNADGVYALLKPFNKSGQVLIWIPATNIQSYIQHYFVTFEYNHSTLTSIGIPGVTTTLGMVNDLVDANKAAHGTGCAISVGVRTKHFAPVAAGYANISTEYYYLGQKAMITGTIV